MHRFAHATLIALAISAPVLNGALINQSQVSVLGDPAGGTGSPCSGACSVGGSNFAGPLGNGAVNSNGKARGGQNSVADIESTSGGVSTITVTGTLATGGQTGHVVISGTVTSVNGSYSGNFAKNNGHCVNLC